MLPRLSKVCMGFRERFQERPSPCKAFAGFPQASKGFQGFSLAGEVEASLTPARSPAAFHLSDFPDDILAAVVTDHPAAGGRALAPEPCVCLEACVRGHAVGRGFCPGRRRPRAAQQAEREGALAPRPSAGSVVEARRRRLAALHTVVHAALQQRRVVAGPPRSLRRAPPLCPCPSPPQSRQRMHRSRWCPIRRSRWYQGASGVGVELSTLRCSRTVRG